MLVNDSHCLLTSLTLTHTDVDDDDCTALCQSICDNADTHLAVLNLSDNLIGAGEGRNGVGGWITGAEALARAFDGYHGSSTLTDVDLSWNSIRGDSAASLGRAIAKNASLTRLNLEYNGFGDAGATAMSRSLEANDRLKVLLLAHNSIRQRGAFVLGNGIRYRKARTAYLSFSGNHPGAIGSRAMLHAVRDLRGEFMVSLDGCTMHEPHEHEDLVDLAKPEGDYALDLADA